MGPSQMTVVSIAKAYGCDNSGTRPKEALYPYTPHQAEGMRIEPPPSVPSARGTSPSATAAALPPEEPPGFLRVSNGFRVGPNKKLSVIPLNPMTGLLVFPRMIAPP